VAVRVFNLARWLAIFSFYEALATYHAQHKKKKEGSANKKGSSPDWHLDIGIFWRRLAGSSTVVGVRIQASPNKVPDYVIHLRKVRGRISRKYLTKVEKKKYGGTKKREVMLEKDGGDGERCR
jgi:hypothetical protein